MGYIDYIYTYYTIYIVVSICCDSAENAASSCAYDIQTNIRMLNVLNAYTALVMLIIFTGAKHVLRTHFHQ